MYFTYVILNRALHMQGLRQDWVCNGVFCKKVQSTLKDSKKLQWLTLGFLFTHICLYSDFDSSAPQQESPFCLCQSVIIEDTCCHQLTVYIDLDDITKCAIFRVSNFNVRVFCSSQQFNIKMRRKNYFKHTYMQL